MAKIASFAWFTEDSSVHQRQVLPSIQLMADYPPPVIVIRSSSFPTWMSAPVSDLRREIVAPLVPMIRGNAERGRPVRRPTASISLCSQYGEDRKLTMSRSLGPIQRGLEHRHRLVQILLFTPDDPIDRLVPLGALGVVLPDLPVPLLGLRPLVPVRIDPSRLGGRIGGSRGLVAGLWRRRLRNSEVSAGRADLTQEVLLVCESVIVLLGDGERSRCLVGCPAAGVLARRALDKGLHVSSTQLRRRQKLTSRDSLALAIASLVPMTLTMSAASVSAGRSFSISPTEPYCLDPGKWILHISS